MQVNLHIHRSNFWIKKALIDEKSIIMVQGSKSSANWLISAILELIFMVSEISVNPLKKIVEGGGVR